MKFNQTYQNPKKVCIDRNSQEFAYGPLTEHFYSATNNIGNCQTASYSTSEIELVTANNSITIKGASTRIMEVKFECSDLDNSISLSTKEAKDVQLEILHYEDVFSDASFSTIKNISTQLNSGSFEPTFNFTDFINAIETLIVNCKIEFELWSSSTDPTHPADFSSLDVAGSKEVKLILTDEVRSLYSFWLVSKGVSGSTETLLSKQLFTVEIDLTSNFDVSSIPWPPILRNPLEDKNFTVELAKETNTFTLSIPERYDGNNNSVALEIQSYLLGNISTSTGVNVTKYLTFNNQTNNLSISIRKEDLLKVNGTHKLTFILTDDSV